MKGHGCKKCRGARALLSGRGEPPNNMSCDKAREHLLKCSRASDDDRELARTAREPRRQEKIGPWGLWGSGN